MIVMCFVQEVRSSPRCTHTAKILSYRVLTNIFNVPLYVENLVKLKTILLSMN